jgi:hypothetical protein
MIGMEAKPTRRRFNLGYLKDVCKDIVLIEEYDESINSKSRIKGECKTENCVNTFDKSFTQLCETGGYCDICTKENRKVKVRATNLQRFGCVAPAQNKEVQERMQQTCLVNFGCRNAFQNEGIKEKIKDVVMKRYNVISTAQIPEAIERRKQTCLENYGVEHPAQNKDVQERMQQTCLVQFGCRNAFQNEEIKERIKQQNIEQHGVEYNSQRPEVKERSVATCLEKYNVEHPAQNTEIAEKSSKNAYKLKDYKLPSGATIKIQGYEGLALNDLLNSEHLDESQITTGVTNVPVIWYTDVEGTRHRHFVDIYIPHQNRMIEVKSTWTAAKKKDLIFVKQEACQALGYNYEIWVYDKKGRRVEIEQQLIGESEPVENTIESVIHIPDELV